MFGIGGQEMVLIGILALVIFGPGKLPAVARDLGGFVRKARLAMDEFRSELEADSSRSGGGAGRNEGAGDYDPLATLTGPVAVFNGEDPGDILDEEAEAREHENPPQAAEGSAATAGPLPNDHPSGVAPDGLSTD